MNRDAFLARLRQGLSGMSSAAIDDIVSDYDAHFTEGRAAGRSEEAVAQALGDPGRLARELKAEAGLKRWEEQRNPTAAAGAIFAVLGLGAIDLLILDHVLIGVGSALFGLFVGAIGIFFGGAFVFLAGLFNHLPGFGASPVQASFAGLGMMSGSVSAGAVLGLIVVGLVNLLVRYGRLHYRLLQPAVGH